MLRKLVLALVIVLGPAAVRAMPDTGCGEISPTDPGLDRASSVQRVTTRIPVLHGEICGS